MKKPRLALDTLAPQPYRGLVSTDQQLRKGTLADELQELVRLRISQINGCTFCVDLHGHDLRDSGVPFAKLNLLAAWHEAPCFDAREKAALRFAECMTAIEERARIEAAYAGLEAHFTEKEIAELILVVATINALNRVAISTGIPVPARRDQAA